MHGFVDSSDIVPFTRVHITDCKTVAIFLGNWDIWVVSMLYGGGLLTGDAMEDALCSAYSLASQCNYSEN